MANMELCEKITVNFLGNLLVRDIAEMIASESVEELEHRKRMFSMNFESFYKQTKFDLEYYGRVRNE